MVIILNIIGILLLLISVGLSALNLSLTEHIMFFVIAFIMFSMAGIYKMLKNILNKKLDKEEAEKP